MSINRKKLDKIISKALNETLEEKASRLVSKLKEGELAGEHPLFGKLNFATMSRKEKEELMNKFYGGGKKKDDDWREIEVGSDDEDYFEDEEEFYDEEDESVEMEEGFDSMELKNFRKRKDFDPEEFEDIPLGDVGFDDEMMDDDTGVDLPRRFTNDIKRAIKHRRNMEDEYGDEEFTEGKEGMCEQCGGSTMKEGECEECGYKMEGIYDVDDIDNEENEFDYTEEEMNEEDENIRKDDSGEGRMEKFCNTESPDYDQDACDYHKKQGGAEMTEKLHGGQKKLDKNKNGRIDAADFKMLRAMKGNKSETDEEVEEGNAFTGALAKAKKEGKDEFEVDGKKYDVKESRKKDSITLTEEQMIDLIERVVKEQRLKYQGGKPRGLQKYQQAHEKSGKENKDNLTAVGKKMKDYLKDGSKGDFDMEPKKFPMGNGELDKMKKKAYQISDAGKDFIDSYQRPGMENLDYDEIHPNEDWMKDTIEGSSRTGNNPKWANAVETEVNEKINKKRKENKYAKAKRAAYQKSAQPVVNDKTGDEDGTGIHLKVESENPKEKKKLNEEFGRMKNLIDYNRKTQ